jgi:hypothetical protein
LCTNRHYAMAVAMMVAMMMKKKPTSKIIRNE